MEKQKRAWIYCRIDAPEDAHGSLKKQKKELFDYAEQMDFAVCGSSEDIGSPMDFDRSGLFKVKKAAEEGQIDVLLIKNLRCLGNDPLKTADFFRELGQLGIRLYSPMEGEIYL
jgi:DNA invertase Pin-like site-specific DNA recombinase